MNVELFSSLIKDNLSFDYPLERTSKEDIALFKERVSRIFNIELEPKYLTLLELCDGFHLNGLYIYSSRHERQLGIFNAEERNDFWWSEVDSFRGFFILGEGDMDFYVYEPKQKKYLVLERSTLDVIKDFSEFDLVLEEFLRVYN